RVVRPVRCKFGERTRPPTTTAAAAGVTSAAVLGLLAKNARPATSPAIRRRDEAEQHARPCSTPPEGASGGDGSVKLEREAGTAEVPRETDLARIHQVHDRGD